MANFLKSGLATLCATSLFAALLAGGCTTKAKARAEAQRAFHAGQQKGVAVEVARQTGIIFNGPVRLRVVPWTEGLTLSEAIVTAHYLGQRDPQLIIVSHGSERAEFTPKDLLNGVDFPLQLGDAVEIVP